MGADAHRERVEGFAEVVVDGAGADEQLSGDFLIRGPLGREARDLCFLRGRRLALIDVTPSRGSSGRPELDPGALGERFHAELREQRMGAP